MQNEKKKKRRKTEKIIALIISLSIIALSTATISNWMDVGIYKNCPLENRLLYPFFHGGIVHAMLNAWCFISIVFIYDITLSRLLLAYLVAITFPMDMLYQSISIVQLPTIGLSGVVFFLLASISFEVRQRWYYQLCMAFYLLIGFVFPNTNSWLHLYCYLCGILFALLNYPVQR